MSRESAASAHEVRVRRLDHYLAERGIDRLAMLKVDVEGFEWPLLQGFTDWLEQNASRPVILCEVAPGAYPPQGVRVEDLFELLLRFGYRAHAVGGVDRPLAAAEIRETTNVLFRAEAAMAL
jgi:hypothetical protein